MLNKALLAVGGGSSDAIGPVYNYHGFKLQRHISNEATIITYKAADGKIKRIAVKDAKFRAVLRFGTYNIDIPEMANFKTTGYLYMLDGYNTVPYNQPIPDEITNDRIFSRFTGFLITEKTARENCDIWMKYDNISDSQNTKGVPAVSWCRKQTIGGKICDLGNAYEVAVILSCGDKLDEFDATSNSYPILCLGYTSTGHSSMGRRQSYKGLQSSELY